jgi:hypothetical protein
MPLTLQSPLTVADACDEIVRELLSDCGVSEPPVEPLALAEQLELQVLFDAGQFGRARIKRLCGRTAIYLKPDDRPERLHWATAHEIGEWLSGRILERSGLTDLDDDADVTPARREQIANEFAARLLLPADWFLADAEELDSDVPALKRRYATASHELILMGLLRLPGLAMVSVFDQGRLTRRRGNGQLPPPRLLPIEREVWTRVHQHGEACELWTPEVRVQGWPVHEPGWKRELLRTTPNPELEFTE